MKTAMFIKIQEGKALVSHRKIEPHMFSLQHNAEEWFNDTFVEIYNPEFLKGLEIHSWDKLSDGLYPAPPNLAFQVYDYCDRGACAHGDAGCYAKGISYETCWAVKKATLELLKREGNN